MYDTDGFDNLDTPVKSMGLILPQSPPWNSQVGKPKFIVSVQLVDYNGHHLYYASHPMYVYEFSHELIIIV